MAAGKTSGANIPALYSELNRLGNTGDYDRALKTANKILAQAPDEEEALQCKIVCLLQLSKFQEALTTINKNPKFAKNLLFEKAYTQYRLNQPSEALKTVDSVGTLDLKLKELKAQILYRLEDYEASFNIYRDIIKNTSDDYEDEREANLAAVISNIIIENPAKKLPQLRESTYELTYNAACQLVARSQFSDAEKKLKNAEKLCREALEEDGATEEDIEAELGIIRCQMAYCMQIQGREKEAQSLYNSILKSKPSDIGLTAVASNNSTAINREQNVFDSKKKIKSATAEGVEHKLSKRQRKNIAFNQCLLSIFTNQAELFKELNRKLKLNYPEMEAQTLLLQAVQLFWENQTAEAAKLLEKVTTGNVVEMKLTAVHMLLTVGERKEASRILEGVLAESGYKPAIIGALVTIYMAENQRDKASKVFKNAVEWYKKNQSTENADLSALWRQAADFHLRGGEPQVAAHSLEELLRLHPTDNKTLAQLVIAYSNFDPAKAQSLSKKLPPCTLTNVAEVDALETSNWMMGTKVIKKAAKVEASPKPGSSTGELQKKKKPKKKRKIRLPKNYEAGVTPDPERWLPKHERTGYRKKKDRRQKEVMKGSQGAATGASDLYDMSKMAPKSSPAPTSPGPQDSQGPRQQHKKHQQQKKKKGKRDTAYLEEIEADIQHFSSNPTNKRVLIFPPVANFRRFLIHKVVEASFPDLKTFSVGEGDDRRTVVCFLTDFKPEVDPEPPAPAVIRQASKRPRTMPSLGIYRPPAARKLEDNADVSYHSIPLTSETSTQCDEEKVDEVTPTSSDEGTGVNNRLIRKTANKKERQRRPDMAVYVPRGQRIAQEHQRKLEALSKVQDGVELRLENSLFEDADSDSDKPSVPTYEPCIVADSIKNIGNVAENTHINDENRIERKDCSLNESLPSPAIIAKASNTKVSPLDSSIDHKLEDSGHTLDNNSLEIKDSRVDNCEIVKSSHSETDSKKSNEIVGNGNVSVQIIKNDRKENEPTGSGELDWEVLYDDSGECLDASLMSQLTKSVGQVSIEKPRSTYDDYTHRSFQEEFPHVVEIYDFPAEFKTPDLMMIFSDYKNSGFEIKWVDDTHALGVFSNASVVGEVLRLQHPLVKTRCMSEGSSQSKNKARRCADSLTPYVPRPDTCAALARRLVTGALGVKLPTQRAEREAERRILQQAREKKRLAAKQREEAWEGNFS